MPRALLALALLLPAACKEEKKPAPAGEAAAAPAAAPTPAPAPAQPAEPAAGDAQSMKQAMELICDAPNRASVPAGASDSERAMITATWIKDNVTNAEALDLMGDLASVM